MLCWRATVNASTNPWVYAIWRTVSVITVAGTPICLYLHKYNKNYYTIEIWVPCTENVHYGLALMLLTPCPEQLVVLT